MKIWHQYPLEIRDFDRFLNSDKSSISPSGIILTPKISKFAGNDKKLQELKAALAQFNDIDACKHLNLGLKVPRNFVYQEFIETFEVNSSQRIGENFIIRHPIKEDFDRRILKKDSSNISKAIKTIFHLDEKIEPRNLESLFRTSAENGICGIAFDIEQFSKGQLALAKKFNLETMLTGIANERHEEIVSNIQVDHCVVLAT